VIAPAPSSADGALDHGVAGKQAGGIREGPARGERNKPSAGPMGAAAWSALARAKLPRGARLGVKPPPCLRPFFTAEPIRGARLATRVDDRVNHEVVLQGHSSSLSIFSRARTASWALMMRQISTPKAATAQIAINRMAIAIT
jgi:hypothetical protein